MMPSDMTTDSNAIHVYERQNLAVDCPGSVIGASAWPTHHTRGWDFQHYTFSREEAG
jgi:hypothetical protein